MLLAPSMTVRVIGGILAGVKMTLSFMLGHDAVHRNLVESSNANIALAKVFSILTLHNYRLQVYDHVQLHHLHLNGEQVER